MIELTRFRQHLQSLGPAFQQASYLIAYSGGVDSHVLLHLCQRLGLKLRAVHVHHGLQAQADGWTKHCERICAQLEVDLSVLRVDASPARGESPEDAARKARYAAFQQVLTPGECLLTGHHANDQAETLLLQLMRGAGAAGLAAMPACKPFAGSWHGRPLLEFSRADMLAYASAESLDWIEDPSNCDTDYDRNLLRRNVLPLLHERWPTVEKSISRSAALQQESLALIETLAGIDLAAVSTNDARVLSASRLQTLSRARQINLLRTWLRLHAGRSPGRNQLLQLVDSLVPAADDAAPLIQWGGIEIRRFQQHVYLLSETTEDIGKLASPWDGKSTIRLGEHISVRAAMDCTPGLDMRLLDEQLSLRFRRSGERLQVSGKAHHQRLKKLMQEAGIPPWQRARIPLLYVNDEIACVCGYWLADAYVAKPGDPGWLPVCSFSED
ncbi:MAG: tRNA lysidine(34) synthetase TilS [Gammaproteobacteria bacterium]